MSIDVPPRALPVDPIVLADELCELLSRSEQLAAGAPQITALLHAAGAELRAVLAEVQRRGLLGSLLPIADPSDGRERLELLVSRTRDERISSELAAALVRRGMAGDGGYLAGLLLTCDREGFLPAVFLALINGGLYEPLRALLGQGGEPGSAALRALCQARPSYDYRALNQLAVAELGKPRPADGSAAPYDLLIVPGFTPVNAPGPVHLRELGPARQRIELAAQDFLDGKAGYVLLSGGNVHPAGTPYNEALMMREYLLELGVSPRRILVDPHARHTTTNLRNAGRCMLALGLSRGLIVTGFESAIFSQAFYLGYPDLSTFLLRCQSELGYEVGALTGIDDHHIAFTPDPACPTPSYHDPLDY